ncbi:disease resistance protein RPS2-like [Hibiscus syriacus]|uniref:disease resistance protein RPS2-like n=1 Tax=Hibiscus syriacus TaxID=106335 RepID=UPI001922AEAD|nr:disease resistance protein RPS2-like [Hibiscus syriacus]
MDVRAARLLERLKTEKNVLIILDDVWENLELGVPTTDEHKGCKILMMSRSLGIPEKAYSAIEMSYKFLENEELQPIFLLCSIMGHDAAIEDLLRYARGLGLLHGVKRVKDTRDKVLSLVNILKASCLLLDGSHPTRSDMHDVVRDVAISIASRDYGWLVLTKEDVYEEWSDEGTMRKCELVSLRSAKVSELPDGLECPVLTFFSMHDLIDCKRLEVIAPDFLSSLSSLEELYLYGSFDRWEVEGIDNPRSNASLVELQCLSHLNTLEVQIRDVQAMPKDDMFFGKLERYKIFIGDLMWYELYDGLQMNTSRILQVKMKKSINLYGGITLLLRNVRSHWLEEVEDVRKMLYDPITEGFLDLKHLRFRYVLDIKVLLSSMMLVPCFESLSLSGLTDLEAICDRQLKVGSFDRLRIIKVESCNALKNLFFFPIATKFCQLEEIIVSNCHNMIGLIVEEEKMGENEILEFRQLLLLELRGLDSFNGMWYSEKTSKLAHGFFIKRCLQSSFLSSY